MRSSLLSSPRPLLALTVCGLALASASAHAAPACPSAVVSSAKGNQMYLYFPTSSDSTFPKFANNLQTGSTTPLGKFDVASLDPAVGTTAQLRDRVRDMVIDDYCEFDVKVTATTSKPGDVVPRWQVVGIGSDAATDGGNVFGASQATDTGDADAKDHSRVFAGSFKVAYGQPGYVLEGPYSTLERWATAISGTASHEAGHNYGLAHDHAHPKPFTSEDDVDWHIMATNTDLTGEIRVGRDRHFSDTEYEILGHNLGLNTRTLHNWDFINPNGSKADGMRLKLLSTSQSLDVHWWYDGSASPWQKPTVTYTGTTQTFQGKSYFVHDLDFTDPKAWAGATPGVVDAGADFHTGVTFAGNVSVIVYDVDLLNGGSPLKLAPRIAGYDAGTMDLMSGDFVLDFFNTAPEAGELVLSEVRVFRSPRMLDIASMMRDTRPVDVRGLPIEFTSRIDFGRQELRDSLGLSIGRLTEKRSVDIVYGPEDCPRGSLGSGSPEDGETSEREHCLRGNALSLFPATYTYVIATVVEPNARYWSRERNEYVTGPLQNIIYYQLAGIVPDLNQNGVDDLIDLRTGTSRDGDRNGVPDEAQR